MASTITISQNLLNKFIKQKKLSGAVSFLRFLKKRSGLQCFYSFCALHKHDLHSSGQLPKGVLFHGSQKLQSSLVPNASMERNGKVEQKAFVYATDDPNYAIFLALLNLKNGRAGVMARNKNPVFMVDIDFVNGLSKFQNGYVHIVPDQMFKKTKNREYKTDIPIKIMFAVPVTLEDLTVPIYIQTKP